MKESKPLRPIRRARNALIAGVIGGSLVEITHLVEQKVPAWTIAIGFVAAGLYGIFVEPPYLLPKNYNSSFKPPSES